VNTHLAPQALFTQSSPVHELLLQAFPFPSTLGELTLHQLSQACMFIYNSHGKWAFSPLLWSFPPTATFTSFLAPGCWACVTTPAFSSWLVARDFPSLSLCCMSFLSLAHKDFKFFFSIQPL
jgi:hypothetical protein